MKLSYLLPATIIMYASCSYRPNCEDPQIRIRFANADSAELANVKVKKYGRGQGFTKAMDSATLDLSSTRQYTITSYDDWQFELPEAAKVFRIDQIDINDDKGEKRSMIGAGELKPCTNGMSFRVNENNHIQQPQSYNNRGQAGEIDLYK